jgi:hypothetical protein
LVLSESEVAYYLTTDAQDLKNSLDLIEKVTPVWRDMPAPNRGEIVRQMRL